jgi:hypothetical protein
MAPTESASKKSRTSTPPPRAKASAKVAGKQLEGGKQATIAAENKDPQIPGGQQKAPAKSVALKEKCVTRSRRAVCRSFKIFFCLFVLAVLAVISVVLSGYDFDYEAWYSKTVEDLSNITMSDVSIFCSDIFAKFHVMASEGKSSAIDYVQSVSQVLSEMPWEFTKAHRETVYLACGVVTSGVVALYGLAKFISKMRRKVA